MSKQIPRNLVLMITTIASFLTPFMGSAVNIALPTIGKEFGMNAVLLGWVPAAYMLAAAIFLVPIGRIADIWGRKRIFLAGIVVYLTASVLCALSVSGSMLIGFRIIEGVGGAMIFGTGVAILTTVFPQAERGKALGINVSGVYLGLSMGPVLGGFLTQHLGWRSVYWFNVPLCLFVIGGIIWKLKGEWTGAGGEKLDYAGALMYGASLFATMFGLSRLPGIDGIAWILFGVVSIVVFGFWETRTNFPLVDIGLFKGSRAYTFSNIAALINYSATSAVSFLLSLYLQFIKGLSPDRAGLILIAQPVIMTVFSPLAGRLSDRIEPRVVSSVGMAMCTVGLVMLATLVPRTPFVFVLVCLVFMGLGFACFSSPNTNAVMSSVDKRFYGVASGTLGTMRLVGQMMSMGFAMLVFSLVIGRVEITPQYYQQFMSSFKILFGIFAALCFAGVFASLSRGTVHGDGPGSRANKEGAL
jgi:EmrB/QacA subfamily drug resistance transporter